MGSSRRAPAYRRRTSASSSTSEPAGGLASAIFGCTNETYDECVQQLIFGRQMDYIDYVKKIQPGMPLFLFNYKSRELHGIFEAESQGGLNINPYAWTDGSKETPFPAQVRVRVRCLYQPLSEMVFRSAINYVNKSHFNFLLDHMQTDMLFSLFARNVRLPDGPQMRAQSGPVPQTASSSEMRVQSVVAPQSDEEGWSKPKKVARGFWGAWQNARPFEYPPASTFNNQGITTTEHRDHGYEDGAGETAGVEDPQGSAKALVEDLPAENPLHRRSDIHPNLGMTDNGEEHKGDIHKKEERELEVLENLRESKGKSISGGSQGVRGKVLEEQVELGSSGSSRSTEKLPVIDAPLPKVRQEEIKLRQILDEALGRDELLRELEELKIKNAALVDSQDQLNKRNATLEHTQVRMAAELEGLSAELEGLRDDVVRLSRQVQSLQGMGVGFGTA